jgi:hypothetical protein
MTTRSSFLIFSADPVNRTKSAPNRAGIGSASIARLAEAEPIG